MFFIFGMSSKQEELDFNQTIICKTCGSYGRLEAFMTYSYFSLFFIKILKWNKKYYIRSTCCGTIYKIDETLGKLIKRGESIKIEEWDLEPVNVNYNNIQRCKDCSYPVEDEFEYCPRCGAKL